MRTADTDADADDTGETDADADVDADGEQVSGVLGRWHTVTIMAEGLYADESDDEPELPVRAKPAPR